jgi:hypothetical protein
MRCTAVFIAQLRTPGHADWLMVVYRSFVLSRAPSDSVTVSYSTSQEQIRDPVTQPNQTSRSYVRCVIEAQIACALYSWNMRHGWDWAQAGQSGIRFPTEAGMFSLTITTSTRSGQRRLLFSRIRWPEREADHYLNPAQALRTDGASLKLPPYLVESQEGMSTEHTTSL